MRVERAGNIAKTDRAKNVDAAGAALPHVHIEDELLGTDAEVVNVGFEHTAGRALIGCSWHNRGR